MVFRNIEWPSGLTIDHPTKRLYWVDFRKSTVESCMLLTGGDRHVLKELHGEHKPKLLDVFEDTLYIILLNQDILKLNKFGNDNGTIVYQGTKGYRSSDLNIVHQLKQNQTHINPCKIYPCDSSTLCVLSAANSKGRTCLCEDNKKKVARDTNGEITSCSYITEESECKLNCFAGKCKIIDGEQKCICPMEYTGPLCENYICSGYCYNQGKCEIVPDNYMGVVRKCRCPHQWTGDRCENSLDECHSYCHNGGNCTISRNGAKHCKCPTGFDGDTCQHCSDLVCENNSVCRKMISNTSHCDCRIGFSGRKCEIDNCRNYCKNGGMCTISGTGAPNCECLVGTFGGRCENRECNIRCLNGGTCVKGPVPYCHCIQGYIGEDCSENMCHRIHNRPSYCPPVTAPPPTTTTESSGSLCDNHHCYNGGQCLEIRNQVVCNCTMQYNGQNCMNFVGYNHSCRSYCKNNGICQLNDNYEASCVCIGEWIGPQCTKPPNCVQDCGVCQAGSSINECLCSNGQYSICLREYSADSTVEPKSQLVTILLVVLVILVTMVVAFTGFLFGIRKRRGGQQFSHARMTENVEITNPMYLGDADEAPSFIHDDDKVHFANPVYESMYAGTTDLAMPSNSISLSSAPEEKKKLLHQSQDDTNAQDLL